MSFLAFSTSPYLHNHPPWREDHWIYGSTMLGLKDGGWIDSCGVGKVEHGTVWTGRKATQHALDLLLSSWENVTVMWTKSIWGGAKPYLPYIFCCVLFERSTLIIIFFFFFFMWAELLWLNPSHPLLSLCRWGIWVFSSCFSSLSLQRWEWSCLVTWVRTHCSMRAGRWDKDSHIFFPVRPCMHQVFQILLCVLKLPDHSSKVTEDLTKFSDFCLLLSIVNQYLWN